MKIKTISGVISFVIGFYLLTVSAMIKYYGIPLLTYAVPGTSYFVDAVAGLLIFCLGIYLLWGMKDG